MEASPLEAADQTESQTGLGRRFWTLISAIFLAFLGIGTVLPAMALHVRRDLGGSNQTIGFVIGTFSAVALASRFISGPLADRRGRKTAFLTGLVSCSAAGLAYLLPIGIASAYLGRGLQGFGEACLYTGAAAWAVEVAGIHRSSRALGFVSTGIWGGMAAGPLLGQWIGSFERAAALQVVTALAALVLLLRVDEHFRPHPDSAKRKWPARHVLDAGLVIGFVNVQYPVVAGFLILHLAQHGGGGPTAYSAYAGMVLISRSLLGGLPDRISPAYTFYTGMALMAIGTGLLAITDSPALSITASAILGLGFSFPWASVASTVLKRTPSHEHGSTIGVISAFYDIFVGTSSFIAGFMAQHYGYASTFTLACGSAFIAAALGLRVFRRAVQEPA
jgi:MFS family permease